MLVCYFKFLFYLLLLFGYLIILNYMFLFLFYISNALFNYPDGNFSKPEFYKKFQLLINLKIVSRCIANITRDWWFDIHIHLPFHPIWTGISDCRATWQFRLRTNVHCNDIVFTCKISIQLLFPTPTLLCFLHSTGFL